MKVFPDRFKEKFNIYPYFSAKLPSLVILLFVIVYFVSILLVITPMYIAVDDKDILDDIKSGFPVSFMSHVLGEILSFFYEKISVSIPWYGIFLYISYSLSLFVLLQILLIDRSARNIIISSVIVILYMKFIQNVGYNSAAIITGGISVLGIFVAFYRDKISWHIAVGYGLMLCLCFLWRIHALLLVVVFLFPILVIRIRKYWIYFILYISPCILLFAFNTFASHFHITPEQKYYNEFNNYRGKFHGTDLYELNKENRVLLQDIGWTENDFLVYRKWLFVDENKYNIETAKQILYNPAVIKSTDTISAIVQRVIESCKMVLWVYREWIIIIICELLLLILYCNRSQILLSFIFFVYVMIATILLAVLIRYPIRIGVPMFFIITCFLAFLLLKNDATESRVHRLRWNKLHAVIVAVGLLLLVFWQVNLFVYNEKLNKYNGEAMNEVIKKIKSTGTDSVILPQNCFSFKPLYLCRNPLKEYKEEFLAIPTGSGWPIFSPRFYAIIQKIGLKRGSEIFPYIVNSKNAFVICEEDFAAPLSLFIKETYGIRVKFKLVDTLPALKLDSNIYDYSKVGILDIFPHLKLSSNIYSDICNMYKVETVISD